MKCFHQFGFPLVPLECFMKPTILCNKTVFERRSHYYVNSSVVRTINLWKNDHANVFSEHCNIYRFKNNIHSHYICTYTSDYLHECHNNNVCLLTFSHARLQLIPNFCRLDTHLKVCSYLSTAQPHTHTVSRTFFPETLCFFFCPERLMGT